MHVPVSSKHRQAGFSLPEVAMSIGIIAVAFVALIALIPAGLGQMRSAMDTNNETRIVQSLMAVALATEYARLPQVTQKLYYFDDEGSYIGTSEDPLTPIELETRLYEAKMFVEPAVIQEANKRTIATNSRVLIVYGSRFEPQTDKLKDLEYQGIASLATEDTPGKRLHIRTISIAKTDGIVAP